MSLSGHVHESAGGRKRECVWVDVFVKLTSDIQDGMKQEQHKRALLAIHTHTHIHNSMHTHTHTHACTHNLHTSHRKQTWTDAIVSDSRPCNSFSPRNTPPPPPPSPPTPHPPSPSPPTPSSEPSEFGVSGTATRASCE